MFSAYLMALALNGAAWGEIYETTDAEGNPEFTNSPPEANTASQIIKIQQTNVVDAPQLESQTPGSGSGHTQEQQPDTVESNYHPQKSNAVIIDNPNANDAYDQALIKQQAFERMNPAAPHQVLNAEAPHQVGDFSSETPSGADDTTLQAEDIYNPAEHRTIHHRR